MPIMQPARPQGTVQGRIPRSTAKPPGKVVRPPWRPGQKPIGQRPRPTVPDKRPKPPIGTAPGKVIGKPKPDKPRPGMPSDKPKIYRPDPKNKSRNKVLMGLTKKNIGAYGRAKPGAKYKESTIDEGKGYVKSDMGEGNRGAAIPYHITTRNKRKSPAGSGPKPKPKPKKPEKKIPKRVTDKVAEARKRAIERRQKKNQK